MSNYTKVEWVGYASRIEVNGKIRYYFTVCSKCGACVTLTNKQRWNGEGWIWLLDKALDCCASPDYYYGDWLGFYKNGG